MKPASSIDAVVRDKSESSSSSSDSDDDDVKVILPKEHVPKDIPEKVDIQQREDIIVVEAPK